MPLLYRFMIIFAFDRVLASGTKQHCFSDHEDDGRVVARDVRMVEGKERIIERVIERDGRDGKWDATEFCDQEKRQRWIIVRTVSCDHSLGCSEHPEPEQNRLLPSSIIPIFYLTSRPRRLPIHHITSCRPPCPNPNVTVNVRQRIPNR